MPDFGGEIEFQAHISFAETAPAEGDPEPEPDTSPSLPYGSIVGPGNVPALAGRSYRATAQRLNPLDDEDTGAAGVYYILTDYDVAMADLAYNLNIAAAGNLMRKGDLIRIGALTDATGRVRGVYQLRCAPGGGLGAGVPDDVAGSLVNLTMERVNPNIAAP